MKTLYIDCGMGAAGDMLMAALLELCEDKAGFIAKMNHLGLPGVKVAAESSVKCGITGTHVLVRVHGEEEDSEDFVHGQIEQEHGLHEEQAPHEKHGHQEDGHGHAGEQSHHHSGMHDVGHMISHLSISDKVKTDALEVYRLIADAESKVHGKPVDEIHFHEVGAMDAVADVVGVCLLMDQLNVEKVVASPVHVGSGQVKCAHGILPVPAPATAHILKGVPIYGGVIQGELCTPTGAALLKHFVLDFGPMPVMKVEKIGYGMGKKDFEAANCVRASIGETLAGTEQIVELCCNLDDMTPEAVGFAQELLRNEGALDVYTTAIGMKKNRPGIMLTCMCRQEKKDIMKELLFQHTTTLGIREYECDRTTLDRVNQELKTSFGMVRRKDVSGWGIRRSKIEYEDLVQIAKSQNLSLEEVRRRIERELENQ